MASRAGLKHLGISLAILLTSAAPSQACDTPVFRYALERWTPDPYEIITFHRGSAEPPTGAMADLRAACALANVQWRAVDLTEPLSADLGDLEPSAAQPNHLVVRHVRTGDVLWTGAVTARTPQDLLQSPAHSALAEQLQGGTSAVWVLLEMGDPERDDAAAALLSEELDALESSLVLPVESPDLKIAFSLLRVGRDDPREQMLARTLLMSEWDLAGRREPMAFPVFGRGRVLYALTGAGITKANIREACSFLIGPCACEIKDDNPGFDLLMAVDWTSSLGDLISTPALPSVAGLVAASGAPSPIVCDIAVAVAGRDDAPSPSNGLVYGTGLVLLLGITVSLGVTAVLYRRRR
jgi:hypothetical protein